MNTSILNEQHVKEAWKLVRGVTVKELAEETGYSVDTVSLCVNGHKFNRKIAETVMELLAKEVDKLEKFENLKQRHHELSKASRRAG
jgi:hypothetical protein